MQGLDLRAVGRHASPPLHRPHAVSSAHQRRAAAVQRWTPATPTQQSTWQPRARECRSSASRRGRARSPTAPARSRGRCESARPPPPLARAPASPQAAASSAASAAAPSQACSAAQRPVSGAAGGRWSRRGRCCRGRCLRTAGPPAQRRAPARRLTAAGQRGGEGVACRRLCLYAPRASRGAAQPGAWSPRRAVRPSCSSRTGPHVGCALHAVCALTCAPLRQRCECPGRVYR